MGGKTRRREIGEGMEEGFRHGEDERYLREELGGKGREFPHSFFYKLTTDVIQIEHRRLLTAILLISAFNNRLQ